VSALIQTSGRKKVATKKRTQIPRRKLFAERQSSPSDSRLFNYSLNYKKLNLKEHPELYRVGVGEQGVLLVEPYKSEILPHWKFKTPEDALQSAQEIMMLFRSYRKKHDFIGMDMARKFLQMGFTRARRYANHRSGRKYSSTGRLLPFANDTEKAKSAEIFYQAWKRVEADRIYSAQKAAWKQHYG